ncbi:MAG: PIG-L family deacetylase [Oligoflexales bacterium]|nr:PIG-L family deacetylase [Oligoflexales bacterium]
MKFQKNLDFEALHVFVVAHPDDWQLFMGEVAYDLIVDDKSRVLLVMLDAGDAGRPEAYWFAREQASLASVRSLHKLDIFRPSEEEDSGVLLAGKGDVPHVKLRRTSSYFYRLPDGSPTGQGFEAYGRQSLYKLWKGKIDAIQSVDGKNRYSLSDLEGSLRELVEQDAEPSTKLVFHLMDSGPEDDLAHSDHFVSQELGRRLARSTNRGDCKVYAFEDYRTKDKTINLEEVESRKKVQLFNAYDLYMLSANQECTVCNRVHFQWLFRSYYRIFSC